MQNQAMNTAHFHTKSISKTISKPFQLVSALLLGIVILYGVGFTQI